MQTPTNHDDKKNRLWRVARFRNIFVLVIVLRIFIFFITMTVIYSDFMSIAKKVHTSARTQDYEFFVNTNACNILAMSPFDNNVTQFVFYPENFKRCPHAPHSLLTHNKTHIWVTEDSRTLEYYNITDQNDLECCYASFYRPDSIHNIYSQEIDNRIRYNSCKYFKEHIKVKNSDEFVRVQCKANKSEVYNRFFIFAPKKIFLSNSKPYPSDKAAFNVLILGIDNMSRLNFHRTMPKTASFLKKRGGVELFGYNKVGDNSFPNIVPLLMGHDHRELKKICLPTKEATYDNCPFIWHVYKEAGYYTAFGEDDGFLGTFNYLRRGFRDTPTDYYMHPFVIEAQRRAGKLKTDNVWLCINEFYLYQVVLNYTELLTETLNSSRMFGFFWESTVTHDHAHFSMILDDQYVHLLERLESSEYLNRTVLLVISDHGIRWGPIRMTKQGNLEERLPLAYFLMPNTFKENYSKAYINLRSNSRYLTTAFDVHETLLDLIDVENIIDIKMNKRIREEYADRRGISLFLPLYGNRTCASAGIDSHWCSCYHYQRDPISKNSKEAISASTYLVESLNTLLIDHPECVKLSVAEIMEAEEMKANILEKKYLNWREFTVTVRVTPSGGVFQGTIHDSWKIVGTVSRLNMYGNQSSCIQDPELKLYCYCRSLNNDVDISL